VLNYARSEWPEVPEKRSSSGVTHPIRLSEANLLQRRESIRQTLAIVSRSPGGPVITRQALGASQLVLGAQDAQDRQADYRTWRFNLRPTGFVGNYFEIWRPVPSNLYSLNRAYLNLYRLEGLAEVEFLCLHCDPEEPVGTTTAAYKRGPHMHISVAGDPFKHAHIALGHSFLASILKNAVTLTTSLHNALRMIDHEVLARYPTKSTGFA
jgi:hypothetical protein